MQFYIATRFDRKDYVRDLISILTEKHRKLYRYKLKIYKSRLEL